MPQSKSPRPFVDSIGDHEGDEEVCVDHSGCGVVKVED
ncbi:MAG: hypothetical protein S4CHLAM81_04900 [Chlamydiales bacterium]|nr:hypothetical protein [Chlamydiales bacterium]MCH9635278.1 hypothetical protein [Chlamydiales bacterium]